MGIFDSRASAYEDQDEETRDSGSGGGSAVGKLLGFLLLGLLGLFFIPAIGIAGLVHKILSRARIRSHLIVLGGIFLNLIVALIWNAMGLWSQVGEAFSDLFGGDTSAIGQLIVPFALANVFLGVLVGLVVVLWSANRLRTTPHLRQAEDSWTGGFKYRRTPLEWLKRQKRAKKLRAGAYTSPKRAPLGLEEETDQVAARYYGESNRQTLLTGTAGSGKTVTILSMIRNDIENCVPIGVLDFKRSPELASKLAKWAAEHGRPFYHVVNGRPEAYDIEDNPNGQSYYDPFRSESPGVLADMALGMREYDTSSAVYKANMQQLLQVLFSGLMDADQSKAPKIRWGEGGIPMLASALEGDNLTDLAIAYKGQSSDIKKALEAVVQASKGKTQIKHAIDELQGQMRTIMSSEYGRWLQIPEGQKGIDLGSLLSDSENGPVVLFSLNADSEPDFARYMGSLILADLTGVSAERRNKGLKNQVEVYVDEFQAVPPTAVMSLLEKSRQSVMGMTLSLQSFEQVVSSSSSGDAYLRSILDTCSNFIIHAGATEPSAIRLAEILGKEERTVYRTSTKNEGVLFSINWFNRRNQLVSDSREEFWKVPPRDFLELLIPTPSNKFKSTAIVLNKVSEDPRHSKLVGGVARKVWMIPSSDVIAEVSPTITSEDKEIEDNTSEVSSPSITVDADAMLSDVGEEPATPEPATEMDGFVDGSLEDDAFLDDDSESDGEGDFEFEKIEDTDSTDTDSENGEDDDPFGDFGELPFFDDGKFTGNKKVEEPKPSKSKEKPKPDTGALPDLDL